MAMIGVGIPAMDNEVTLAYRALAILPRKKFFILFFCQAVLLKLHLLAVRFPLGLDVGTPQVFFVVVGVLLVPPLADQLDPLGVLFDIF